MGASGTIVPALLASVIISTPTAAQTYEPQPYYVAPIRQPNEQIRHRYIKRLEALRNEALAQQQLEGGALTPQSRERLQTRLDKIHADYRRAIRQNDPTSVNADGSARY